MTDLDLMSNTVKARDNIIEEQKEAAQHYKQEISIKDKALDEKSAEVDKLKAQLEEMQKRLGEADKLLNKSEGHTVMVGKINNQKQVTRRALAFVADISRDRSMF